MQAVSRCPVRLSVFYTLRRLIKSALLFIVELYGIQLFFNEEELSSYVLIQQASL